MCEDKNVDGILLMGDMTDFGKLDGYKAGLAYVANALQLGGTRRNASTFCGIVPGNHDIDRALAKKPSMLAKFKPLNRSEEHTSELQSLMRKSYAIFCLKKKKYK